MWSAALDGSDVRPLSTGAALDERPAFSPDGQQIAFISDRGGARAIWIVSRDGGAARELVKAVVISSLSWSPDGQRIVYAAPAGESPGLWTVAVSNGRVSRLPTRFAANEPSWNPARDVIAYVAGPPGGGPAQSQPIAFVDSAGRDLYQPLALPGSAGARGLGFANGILAWSPDGKRLAAISQPTNAAASVWILDPDAAEGFTKILDLPPGPRLRGISWTPDGSSVFVGKRDWTSDIVLLDQNK